MWANPSAAIVGFCRDRTRRIVQRRMDASSDDHLKHRMPQAMGLPVDELPSDVFDAAPVTYRLPPPPKATMKMEPADVGWLDDVLLPRDVFGGPDPAEFRFDPTATDVSEHDPTAAASSDPAQQSARPDASPPAGSAQPAASQDPPARSAQPAASQDPPARSAQPAASQDPPAGSAPPAAPPDSPAGSAVPAAPPDSPADEYEWQWQPQWQWQWEPYRPQEWEWRSWGRSDWREWRAPAQDWDDPSWN
eukprot:s726_g23.t1